MANRYLTPKNPWTWELEVRMGHWKDPDSGILSCVDFTHSSFQWVRYSKCLPSRLLWVAFLTNSPLVTDWIELCSHIYATGWSQKNSTERMSSRWPSLSLKHL